MPEALDRLRVAGCLLLCLWAGALDMDRICSAIQMFRYRLAKGDLPRPAKAMAARSDRIAKWAESRKDDGAKLGIDTIPMLLGPLFPMADTLWDASKVAFAAKCVAWMFGLRGHAYLAACAAALIGCLLPRRYRYSRWLAPYAAFMLCADPGMGAPLLAGGVAVGVASDRFAAAVLSCIGFETGWMLMRYGWPAGLIVGTASSLVAWKYRDDLDMLRKGTGPTFGGVLREWADVGRH